MFLNQVIAYGIATEKKNQQATLLGPSPWFDSLERCRLSFGLEGVHYEYWTYPVTAPEGSIWVKNNKTVILFFSDGFLKLATESQAVVMMESLNAANFQTTRRQNKQKAYSYFIDRLKGESRHFRYWVISFFLYPLERFLKIAKI